MIFFPLWWQALQQSAFFFTHVSSIFEPSWWQAVLAALFFTHLSSVAVTIYLHRCQAHGSLSVNSNLARVFRIFLWLSTGMRTREWVAVHRKHHATVETPEDPHSPKNEGIWRVLFKGVSLYRREAEKPDTIKKFGRGTPDDRLESFFLRWPNTGVILMAIIDVVAFGFLMGALVWSIQMMWMPVFAAGGINGGGHYWGYRNYDTDDISTNMVPWGILIVGEELHNNHHAYPDSAKFSQRWWELDITWCYIRTLSWLRLVRVKKCAPRLGQDWSRSTFDHETVRVIMKGYYEVLSLFDHIVLKNVRKKAQDSVDTVNAYREELNELIKKRRRQSLEELHHELEKWWKAARESGVRELERFAAMLPTFVLKEGT